MNNTFNINNQPKEFSFDFLSATTIAPYIVSTSTARWVIEPKKFEIIGVDPSTDSFGRLRFRIKCGSTSYISGTFVITDNSEYNGVYTVFSTAYGGELYTVYATATVLYYGSGTVSGYLSLNKPKEIIMSNNVSYLNDVSNQKTITLQVDNYDRVTQLSITNNSIYGHIPNTKPYSLDISMFKKLERISLYNNLSPYFNSINFPTSSRPITNFYVFSNPGLTTLNLSGLTGLGGVIQIDNNSSMTSLILPTSPYAITHFNASSNPGLTTLNLSGLTGLGDQIVLSNNSSMTSLILPTSSRPITYFYAYSNPGLTTLNLTGLTGLGGVIRIDNNSSMTSLILPTSPYAITYFNASSNPGLTTLNLTGLTGLGGYIRIDNNSSMTSLILPTSSRPITHFYASSNPGLTTLNLSGLTGLGGDIFLSNNDSMTTLTLPTTTQKITNIDLHHCALSYIDFRPLSGVSQNGIYINIWWNSYNVYRDANIVNKTNFNRMVVELDSTNWTGGTLYHTDALDHNTTDGGYNGTAAVTSLSGKNWNFQSEF